MSEYPEDIMAIISDDAPADPSNVELAKQAIEAGFDNHSVSQFSIAMSAKLAEKRLEGRGGWHNKEYCSADYLSRLLREHVEKGDPVDVANFCMMLHQRGERITSAVKPDCAGVETAVLKHLKWFERFICDENELNSSTPRKVAQNAQDAAAELRAAFNGGAA